MPESTPPSTDRLALALWHRGAKGEARELLRVGTRRRGAEGQRCRLLLQLVDDGTALPTPESDRIALDEVGALVEGERFEEAQIVLHAGGLADDPVGRNLAGLLDRVLSPLPSTAEPSAEALLQLIRAGRASTARHALSAVAGRHASPIAWVDERLEVLAELLDGRWRPPVDTPDRRQAVLAQLRAGDLEGARKIARESDDKLLAAILARLLSASPVPGVLGDPARAIREGRFADAEAGYRRILAAHPDDERAISRLVDLADLRRALGESVRSPPLRGRGAKGALDKSVPRNVNPHAWSAEGGRVSYAQAPRPTVSEAPTAVVDVAREAELLLKMGRPAEALAVYDLLCVRAPDDSAYRKRRAEIAAMVAAAR